MTAAGDVAEIAGVSAAAGAAISPDASRAVVIEQGRARLVETASGRTLHVYQHPGVRSAAISADNRRVVTGGADDTVRVWSGQSGRRIHTLTEHTGNAVAVAFSPDGEFVASASADGTGRVWRTRDWGLNSVLTGHTNALTNVSFSADSEQVVTTGLDGTARVSDIKSSDELFVLAGHRNRVASAVFTGTVGSAIVTSSPDGTIKVWDAVFQPELRELAHLSAPVVTLDVDDHVTATTSDGKRHTLDLSTGDDAGDGAGAQAQAAPCRRSRRSKRNDARAHRDRSA